jgi:hypothetical protein
VIARAGRGYYISRFGQTILDTKLSKQVLVCEFELTVMGFFQLLL